MKVKTSAALTAAATLATVATAQDGAYGRTSDAKSSHRRNKSSISSSVGSAVAPGKVLSKAERQQRREDRADSVFSTLGGQADEKLDYDKEHNWSAFIAKVAANVEQLDPYFKGLDLDFGHYFTPSPQAASVRGLGTTRRPYHLRSLIIVVIAFLLVFGLLYNLIEYLLLTTRASACSISTVYIPVTYTVTPGVPLVSSVESGNATTPDVTYTATTTRTSTLTETETFTSYFSAQPEVGPATADPSTGAPSYVYTVNSAGSTEWVNGISPSSGASLVTSTTTVFIKPVPPTDSAVSAQSTMTNTVTVTPPAYTSMVYSFVGPDLTSTSTSTHYVTYTLSEVSLPPTITTTSTSFPGVSSSGWNATSSTDSSSLANAAETYGPVTETITVISYFGSGTKTTSTHTEFITTTVASAYTTTISQVVESSFGSGFVTTITTAIPVTITPGSGSILFSTSVTAPGQPSVSSAGSSSPISSGTTTPTPSNTSQNSHSTASSGVPRYQTITPGSSGIFQSSGVSAGPTGLSQTSGNATAPATQSPSGGTPGPQTSSSYPKSITYTMSPSSTPGSQATSMSLSVGSSSSVSLSSMMYSPAQITTTVTNTGSFVYSRSIANSTNSIVPNMSPQSSSTGVPAASPQAGGSSSGGSNSPPIVAPTTTRSMINSTTSSIAYGYSPPVLSPSSASISLSLANSFTSASTASNSAHGVSSGNSSPSTLARSTRTRSSLVTASPLTEPSTSTVSTSSALSSSNSSSIAQSSRSPVSSTPPQPSITSTSSKRAQSTKRVTVQTSITSSVSTTTPSVATNPFPASSATSIPTGGCGEHGDFMVNFDELPRFLPTKPKNITITEAPPVPNPYHHLTFSDGYVYAPEPGEPYQPVSQPHLAVFLANATGRMANPFGSFVKPGEIGDGPRDPISAFWFDAHSAFFGCDNPGPDACTLVLSAYKWNEPANAEKLTEAQNVTIPACPSLTSLNCQLHKVEFPDSFGNLTGLQVQAYTGNDQRMFFMDDLALRWSNNSCAAGLLRQSSP